MAERTTGATYLTHTDLTNLMCKAIMRAERFFKSQGIYIDFELCYAVNGLKGIVNTRILIDGLEISRKEWDFQSAYVFYRASWDDVTRAVAESLIMEVFEQLDNNTLYIDEANNNWVRRVQNKENDNG